MSQLKEQNGRYYQECEIVMVATMNKSNLYCNKKSNILSLRKYQDKPLNDSIINQHLYITSNEEIKENDWYYSIKYGILKARVATPNIDYEKEGCKKIIATTDESLEPRNLYGNSGLFKTKLPKPSNSFISKYIEEYNQGNIITDVLVEYKLNQYKFMSTLCTTKEKEYELKVDSNNTITIKKVKDSYSREELIEILYKYNDGIIDRYSQLTNKDLDKWIKENL